MGIVRILFLADTHLGFDFPFRPRIQRRRRGLDFFSNFEMALEPALTNEVDCIVHGGDLLYRSKVPPQLVEMAFAPLKRVADNGTPVYLVPGNHERSAIPHRHLAEHPRIHIFDDPRTFIFRKRDFTLALAGFPFIRSGIRKDFLSLLERTGWRKVQADSYLLCIHQSIEGATVGPSNFMFRYSHDVIRISEIPPPFCAVLCGHIHRFQVLAKDLRGKQLSTPVFYPGAIERTSFAEIDEQKGYLTLDFETEGPRAGRLAQWKFHELYARPMVRLAVYPEKMNGTELKAWVKNSLAEIPRDSVVKLKIQGAISDEAMQVLSAPTLRSLAPQSMNISAAFPK